MRLTRQASLYHSLTTIRVQDAIACVGDSVKPEVLNTGLVGELGEELLEQLLLWLILSATDTFNAEPLELTDGKCGSVE